jgi:hypothetical protein
LVLRHQLLLWEGTDGWLAAAYVAVAASDGGYYRTDVIITDVISHRCMRLKICAIDKKLSFATPRVLISRYSTTQN